MKDFEVPRANRQSTIESRMHPARIAELLRPFLGSNLPTCHSEERSDEEPAVLSPAQLLDISTYIDLLIRWNARINLTAIRDPEAIVARHFGESLFAARRLFPNPSASSASSAVKDSDRAPTVADLGSGAGFPGLPIKLWAPEIALTLIESNHKKAAFLREVARVLTLTDVNVITERAETLVRQGPPQAEVVTLRAVERFDTILPLAIKFLAAAARLALLIGSSQSHALPDLAPAVLWRRPISIPQSHSGVLVIGCLERSG